MGSNSTDPEAVVAADKLDREDVLVVVQLLKPLGAGCRRQAGLDVDLPHAADHEVAPAHHAAADERLVPLRLVEAPHQRPNLQTRHRHYINQTARSMKVKQLSIDSRERKKNSYPSARRLGRENREESARWILPHKCQSATERDHRTREVQIQEIPTNRGRHANRIHEPTLRGKGKEQGRKGGRKGLASHEVDGGLDVLDEG